MLLENYIKNECISLNQTAENAEQVLNLIVKTAKKCDSLNKISEEKILSALKDRETVSSTGFGKGIAIPHCIIDDIDDFIVGVVTLKDGVEFNSIDNSKVKLFFFIIAPKSKRNDHLRVLSKISHLLKDENNIKEILELKSDYEVKNYIINHTKLSAENKKNESKKYDMFTILVQDEKIFNEVINIITEIEDSSMSIINGYNASKFLYSLPLYMNFWSDKDDSYNKIIIATVNKIYANDLIRQLNLIINELKDKTGLLVAVQELVYLNGSLDI